jgi:hypothetical protein
VPGTKDLCLILHGRRPGLERKLWNEHRIFAFRTSDALAGIVCGNAYLLITTWTTEFDNRGFLCRLLPCRGYDNGLFALRTFALFTSLLVGNRKFLTTVFAVELNHRSDFPFRTCFYGIFESA